LPSDPTRLTLAGGYWCDAAHQLMQADKIIYVDVYVETSSPQYIYMLKSNAQF
jgi:NADH:ubiquinone oxidoreductase subunit B-like Fe-S oxidoreductase